MATLEATPGGSAVNLGVVKNLRVVKVSGVTPIPEVFGDSDNVEAVKTVASVKQITIIGTKIGDSSTISSFVSNLNNWGINGDGNTTVTANPGSLQFVDDRGLYSSDNYVVLEVSWDEYGGKILYVDYQIKLLQKSA